MDPLSVEAILRIGAFGCFVGHGWIAAWKLEYGPWSKFTAAAGFTDDEARIIMPLIGWMDLVLGVVTLLRPMELLTAWMGRIVLMSYKRCLNLSPRARNTRFPKMIWRFELRESMNSRSCSPRGGGANCLDDIR